MLRPYQNFYGTLKHGKGCTFGAFVDIGDTTFGSDCKVECFVSIPKGWTFGDRVFIGPGARFANDKHPKIGSKWSPDGGKVGNDVCIGMGAMIGPGVSIGDGAVIGMGAVVIKDVKEGEIVAGNPAKPI